MRGITQRFGLSLGLLLLAANTLGGQEIEFVEDFALAGDRQQVLDQLVPGTEPYYYFHCLHYQNNQQFEQVEAMLDPWIKRFGHTALVTEIRNRQALLTYEHDPQASLEYLRRQLNLRFDHQREIPADQRDLPPRLDAGLISYDTLSQRALANYRNTDGFEDAALDQLAGLSLSPTQLRHLLERLQRPDVVNLPQLINQDLQNRDAQPFGALEIHRQLTLSQLDELLQLRPRLLNEQQFVNIYLTKLQPGPDVNVQIDPAEQLAYLERLWTFVARLDPVHNSLKASVLYSRLDFDRYRGEYDKQRFMDYVRLPRQVHYINPGLLQRAQAREHIADLNADYSQQILLVPIRDDEPLVRDYLSHFLVDAADYSEFEPWIRDTYLRPLLAEVKIVSGLGDSEQWASDLSPEQFQALMKRVDLDFALTNPRFFSVDEQVELDLQVKNVDNLIVKVFEINTENFYRQHSREIDTDINLDGLVPNWEMTFHYDLPPLQRARRTYSFEQIDRPGVYVIDFIGNGKSSRALVRKGRLGQIVETTAAGQRFTIFDEQGQQVPDARLWVAGRQYAPGDDGKITIPFSTEPTSEAAVISRAGFSQLAHFQHLGEQYELVAGLFVDRESLLRGNKAKIVIRPSLRVSGTPAPLSLLKDIRMRIESIDVDGIAASQDVTNLKLNEEAETVHEIQVPARLKQLNITLTASVENVSRAQTQQLSVGQQFALNEIDATDAVRDVHLVHAPEGYRLEVRGKTGEVRPRQPVLISFKPRLFRQPVVVTLQSDDAGLIHLGQLPGIASLEATLDTDRRRSWTIPHDEQSGYRWVNAMAGQVVQIPYFGGGQSPSREEFSLLETRQGTYVSDRFDAISRKPGLVLLNDLPPGDYELRLKQRNRIVLVRITRAVELMDCAVGSSRLLELRGGQPLHVQNVEVAEDSITIQLGGDADFARAHVFAVRQLPRFHAFSIFSQVRDAEPFVVRRGIAPSAYVEGRNIGDEYRYILDRKYAAKFPGNMLARPSLLLNPWSIRTTENQQQLAEAGGEFGAARAAEDSKKAEAPSESAALSGDSDFANLDFLAEGTAELLNLRPDENGRITIDRQQLQGKHYLQIVLDDPIWTSEVRLSLNETDASMRDLRLAHGLDPDEHYSLSKEHSVIPGGQTFTLEDVVTSKFQDYDDLGDVYRLLMTLSGDAKLGEFSFVLQWNRKTEEEKRELYSKYACHELNFFLLKKDPEFFQAVVASYLTNKRDATYLDRWLQNQALESYLQPWNFQRLNIAERILLSQRLADDRANIAQNIQDLYQLTPTRRSVFDHLYDVAVQGNALEAGAIYGLLEDKRKTQTAALQELARRSLPTVQLLAEAAPSGSAGRDRGLELQAGEKLALADQAGNEPADAPARREVDRARGRAELRVGGGGGFGGGGERSDDFDARAGIAAGKFFEDVEQMEELRQQVAQLYRQIAPTEEWVENNYYRLPIEQQLADLVKVNRFWREYAQHPAGETFLSPYFPETANNFTEMMFALAVLDLPLEAPEPKIEYVDDQLQVTPAVNSIAFHQQVRPAIFDRAGSNILVSENFFRNDDRYRYDAEQRYDKFVTEEFVAHVLYGGQVVITNPTSTPQSIDLLIQIPQGAMACASSQVTRTMQLELDAFSTRTMKYFFYFPGAGQFRHYPAHVAVEQRVVAVADPVSFNVVDQPSNIDRQSWAYVSQNGSDQQVLEFLQNQNVQQIDLDKIAFRMKDKAFFQRAIAVMTDRYVYNATLWSYGILHNEVAAIRQFLQHANDFISNCGSYLDCALVTIDPVLRYSYEHREYLPLVNARAHQLGPRRRILNDRLWEQYHQLMRILSQRRTLDDYDQLAVTYYLLLQDRVDEALKHFEQVDAGALNSRIQYDYCDAYLAMYREQLDRAEQIAQRYAGYAVNRWSDRFQAIAVQVQEIRGGKTVAIDPRDRDQTQTESASKAPSFDFTVQARNVIVNYQNLSEVTVNYYEMDIELLFSRNPFVQQQVGGFAMIRPNMTQQIALPPGASKHTFPLPAELRNSNLLVEIAAGDQTKSQAYYAHSLAVQLAENYGQLQVSSEDDQRPISRVYVKVYARKQDGSVQFYKDGYTDLRGRFDYASLSNQPLGDVSRFAILILSDEQGAVVREADPPKS